MLIGLQRRGPQRDRNSRVAPLHGEIRDNEPMLHLHIEYLSEPFEAAYPWLKGLLQRRRYRNVLFNLDQCGHSWVERSTIVDIMHSIPSVEIFYTFAIETLLAFLCKAEPALLESQFRHLGIDGADLVALEGAVSKNVWLGAAERLVFEAFRTCALYVSPFSINNPRGWRYWLIHFANFYRARQVCSAIIPSRRYSSSPNFRSSDRINH
jgi:three-Cys-motif partner protein